MLGGERKTSSFEEEPRQSFKDMFSSFKNRVRGEGDSGTISPQNNSLTGEGGKKF